MPLYSLFRAFTSAEAMLRSNMITCGDWAASCLAYYSGESDRLIYRLKVAMRLTDLRAGLRFLDPSLNTLVSLC